MNAKTGNNLTDKYLVEKVLKGESRMFGIIVQKTEALVAQIVCRMVPVHGDRKDIVQDIYLKAFEHLAGFAFKSKLSTWIAQISYNTCLNYLEKKKLWLPGDWQREMDGQEEDSQNPGSFQVGGIPSQHPEIRMINQDRSGILADAMESLPTLFRTLIVLYHQQEMSYSEIIEITGLPEGTVKNYLFRARKAMKNYLVSRYTKDEL